MAQSTPRSFDGLEVGRIIVVAINAEATLNPLFEDDPGLERTATQLSSRMKKYIAFIRSINFQQVPHSKSMTNHPDHPRRIAHVHLNLLHTSPPTRSRYDTVDEEMCVPIWPTRGFEGRRPLRLTNPLPWTECYAHTIMDAYARVSHLDERGNNPGLQSTVPAIELHRYDKYQKQDRARESSSFQCRLGVEDPLEEEMKALKQKQRGQEEESAYFEFPSDTEDSGNFALSTQISGVSFNPRSSIASNSPDPAAVEAAARVPSRPTTSQRTVPSAWRPMSAALSTIRSAASVVTNGSTSSRLPTFTSPASREDYPTVRLTSTRNAISPTTDESTTKVGARTVSSATLRHRPSQAFSGRYPTGFSRDDDDSWDNNWEEDEEGGILGAKSARRQCPVNVRIWFDLSLIDTPTDPRHLFEELKVLRALERASDKRYLAQIRKANTERVQTWVRDAKKTHHRKSWANVAPLSSPTRASLSPSPVATRSPPSRALRKTTPSLAVSAPKKNRMKAFLKRMTTLPIKRQSNEPS